MSQDRFHGANLTLGERKAENELGIANIVVIKLTDSQGDGISLNIESRLA